jgi:ribonuclease HI
VLLTDASSTSLPHRLCRRHQLLDTKSHFGCLGSLHPSHEILHSSGICLGSATNNQAEYTVVIGLLADAQHHHILYLSIFLDSQLVVLQLNNVYRVRDPCLFRKYLQVRLLSRHFDSITFTHIPRQMNQIIDNLANIVLDWHISHQATHT